MMQAVGHMTLLADHRIIVVGHMTLHPHRLVW